MSRTDEILNGLRKPTYEVKPMNNQQEEKLFVCPKAKECKTQCGHKMKHKKSEGCKLDEIHNECPACIPVEPEPKKPEMKSCGKQSVEELCGNCSEWKTCKLISRGKPKEGQEKCENLTKESNGNPGEIGYCRLKTEYVTSENCDRCDKKEPVKQPEKEKYIEKFEGKLELEKTHYVCIERPGSRCDKLNPHLVGVIRTKTGVSNIANVERALWFLNGKQVEIIIKEAGTGLKPIDKGVPDFYGEKSSTTQSVEPGEKVEGVEEVLLRMYCKEIHNIECCFHKKVYTIEEHENKIAKLNKELLIELRQSIEVEFAEEIEKEKHRKSITEKKRYYNYGLEKAIQKLKELKGD